MNSNNFEMVAKTLYGLEDVLAVELQNLGAENIEIGRRMVAFHGDKELMYKANFHCRTALRILKPIHTFKAKDADEVYENVKKIEWSNYLDDSSTFAIDEVINSDDFNHSKFVAYRTKDAVVDYFKEKTGKRPSVRINNPDLIINIHISHNDCTISIDSSGESLHKRGYRVDQNEAPLNEVLAAGMILKTGWKGESNFVDPMCGSGTLLIEAAMIALNIPPGVHRKEFAFERWKDFDAEMFDAIFNDDSQEKEFDFRIYGSDISPRAIEISENNIKSAGLGKCINLQCKPLQQYQQAPGNGPGILITNPPYGERITSKDLLGLYEMIGERLKHVFVGYQAWILSYKDECFDQIGLRPSQRVKLINGSLECEFRKYEIFDGKKKEYKQRLSEEGVETTTSTEEEEKPTFKRRESNRPTFERKSGGRDRKSFGEKREGGFRERKSFGEGRDGERRERRPFGEKREGGFRERKSFGEGRDGERRERRPFGEKREGGLRERKSFGEGRDGERRERRPFGEGRDGERKPFGEKKEFEGRERRDFRKEEKPKGTFSAHQRDGKVLRERFKIKKEGESQD